MAIPKSANERIRRKIRSKKITPKDDDLTGRITVKKTANNDPNRNKRKKVAEGFLKFYKEGVLDNADNNYGKIVEDLISVAVEAGDNIHFPFKMSRLVQLKEMLESEVPTVIVRTKHIPQTVHICPVCGEEIMEKSTFFPNDQMNDYGSGLEYHVHRPCGGRFRYPSVDNDEIIRRLKGV